MTTKDFRDNPELRSQLMEALAMPALQQAIACIKTEFEGNDAPYNADPIVSVRMLSQAAAVQDAFANLFKMALPNPFEMQKDSETFGTKYQVSDLDKEPDPPNPADLAPHQIND